MILTDTHTHLYSDQFDEDRTAMVQRAMDAGVKRFFLPAIDSETTDAMVQLQREFPDHIHLMAGLHPTHVKENYREELDHVAQLLENGNYVAIGEIGVDLYWDKSTKEIQMQAFHEQIEWALERDLPIVIHCRDAFDEVFEVLERFDGQGLKGIFHCFTGTLEQAQRAIKCGMKLGIGGVVTFKNGKIDQFLHEIDLKHIVLETDAPYLSPTPYRGKRNESAYLKLVAEKVATIYDKTLAEIAEVTTSNSCEVFGV
ncbi:TatD DNase family protein [Nonlabens sp. Hel1_33_55]|uniref:TatD family hydrolase n=1 Tax=Nonlabens sp. Hel1_33_55 TaxID=1336802 RepID=UPI000875B626|nr:TatD family hydrolase [Nonlabens sp. Hel1_33_55]SCY28064.1 TatD DNase family protein [Nonlabens sp. Hel1_33_55]